MHDATDAPSATIRSALPTIVIAGLGYFVDLFDLLLFSVVRRSSLTALGSGSRLLEDGAWVQNAQLVGLMIGGIAWGIIGDKRGRRTVLFGSILMYSVATLANAFVTSVPQYALLRFVAGIGLAGELGAAVTLVSELVRASQRGTATAADPLGQSWSATLKGSPHGSEPLQGAGSCLVVILPSAAPREPNC